MEIVRYRKGVALFFLFCISLGAVESPKLEKNLTAQEKRPLLNSSCIKHLYTTCCTSGGALAVLHRPPSSSTPVFSNFYSVFCLDSHTLLQHLPCMRKAVHAACTGWYKRCVPGGTCSVYRVVQTLCTGWYRRCVRSIAAARAGESRVEAGGGKWRMLELLHLDNALYIDA